MNLKKGLFALLFMAMTFAMFAATNSAAEGIIEEISIRQSTAAYDVHVRVRWTGNGDKAASTDRGEWLIIRHGEFGHQGVDRVYALLLTAFSMNKTCQFIFNNSNKQVSQIYLKYTTD